MYEMKQNGNRFPANIQTSVNRITFKQYDHAETVIKTGTNQG